MEAYVGKRVDLEKVVVLFIANTMDCIVGEIDKPDTFVTDDFCYVKNPMRLLRRQVEDRENGGIGIEHHLVEFDRVTGGTIALKAVGGFFLSWLSEDARGNYIAMLETFFKLKERFEQGSRIIVPKPSFSVPNLRR